MEEYKQRKKKRGDAIKKGIKMRDIWLKGRKVYNEPLSL